MGGQRDDTSGRRCDRRGLASRPGSIPCSASPGSTRCRLYDALAGDAVDPPHPDPPRAGRRVRRRRLRPGPGSAGRAVDDHRARARSTRSRRSPRRGRTRRRSSSWPARSTPRSTASAAASCTRRPTRAGRSRRSPRTSAGRGRPRRSRRPSPRRSAARWPGRPRPAYVEMPTDIVGAAVQRRRRPPSRCPDRVAPDPDSIVAAARLLDGARRIVIMPGAGIHRASASARAARARDPPRRARRDRRDRRRFDPRRRRLVRRVGRSPVARNGPRLFAEADAVVVVGSRLDDVGTARWTLPLPNLVHIDVDPAVIDRAYPATVGIVGDARLALRGLLDELGVGAGRSRRADPDWGIARARAMREAFDAGVAPDQRAVRDAFLAARAAHAARRDPDPRRGSPELVERLLLAGLRARRVDLAVGVGDARLRARRRPTGRPSRHPAGASSRVRRRRLPVHRDGARDDGRVRARRDGPRSTTTPRSARSPPTRCATTAGRTPRTSTTRTSSRSSGRSASRPSGSTTSPTCPPRWPARRPDPGPSVVILGAPLGQPWS